MEGRAVTSRSTVGPWSVRDVPRGAWLLLELALGYLVWRLATPGTILSSTLAGAGPILFAAAVLAARPADRRFTWAALALAAEPILRMLAAVLPDVWQQIAPGDWVNAVPLLVELGGPVGWVANVVGLVGLWLLGIALGGVRSPIGIAITALGVLLALADIAWLVGHTPEQVALLQTAESVAFSTLNAVGWAFLLGAAVQSLRGAMVVGAALLFAGQVLNGALLWWPLGQNTNFDLLGLLLNGIALAGWLALIGGVVRGEVDAAPVGARSRR